MNAVAGHREEEQGNKTPGQPASREPATGEEERALEQEELEAFRRRKEWSDRVLGGHGDISGESSDEAGDEGD